MSFLACWTLESLAAEQSNKVKALVEGVPNLSVVETVDSTKLADKLDRAVATAGRSEPLGVMVQVSALRSCQHGGQGPQRGDACGERGGQAETRGVSSILHLVATPLAYPAIKCTP
jgi:hypothetical protein